jgi:2-Cys peroxiredoxin 5
LQFHRSAISAPLSASVLNARMTPRIHSGDRVPSVPLARLADGLIKRVDFAEMAAGKRLLVIGVPGAFTPVCSASHVPDIAANADRLHAAGFDQILCVTPDNPWVVDAWKPQVDPAGRLLFLSDGNLALTRALGANAVDHEHFLGEGSSRYMLVARQGVVERFAIEPSILDVTCTRAEDALVLD